MNELIIDNFACAGGASTGIEDALGRPVDYAINHNEKALVVHMANHPHTIHLREDIRLLDPRRVGRGRLIGLGWFSPDCTYHSIARGGKPFRDRDLARRVRGLAWTVPHWMRLRRPRVVMLENVSEFSDWGPLLPDGTRCKARRGMTFRRWHKQIENLGYRIDMRELRACDYGAPTSRKRLFVIARCDGREIVFPEPSHGPGRTPYRTAAECIDWSIPCPSIFERQKPLAEATLRRIARGIMRYVVNNPRPFIVPIQHYNGSVSAHDSAEPMRTITSSPKGGGFALVSPTLIQAGYGEREGQAPRCLDIHRPLGTVVAQGNKHALVTALLARHYGGHENDGSDLNDPIFTITTKDHHSIVASHIVKLRGTNLGHATDEPLQTVSAQGTHFGEVRAFLLKYYGTDQDPRITEPLGTVTTRDRFGLVTVHGERYAIADIGMRMLVPRELARAHTFRDSYILDPPFNGKPLTKTDQVWMLGNSVPTVMAEALVRANVVEQAEEQAA